jgi:hypothetical protein
MLENTSENKILNLENDVQKMLESMKACGTYLHRLNFTKKKIHKPKAPEPSSPRAFKNIESALLIEYSIYPVAELEMNARRGRTRTDQSISHCDRSE